MPVGSGSTGTERLRQRSKAEDGSPSSGGYQEAQIGRVLGLHCSSGLGFVFKWEEEPLGCFERSTDTVPLCINTGCCVKHVWGGNNNNNTAQSNITLHQALFKAFPYKNSHKQLWRSVLSFPFTDEETKAQSK